MAVAKRAKRTKSTSASKTETRCEIDLVGGKYDGQKFGIVFPSPKYLVLSMGLELYERQDPDMIMDATYRYTDNWDAYHAWLEEGAHLT